MLINLQKAKSAVHGILCSMGYEVRRLAPEREFAERYYDFTPDELSLWKTVSPYTMTSPERVITLSRAIDYIVRARIPGDFVECGVWKGGSSMTMALTLKRLGDSSRRLHMYDTYEDGWPQGEAVDVAYNGMAPQDFYDEAVADGKTLSDICGNYESVRAAIASTGFTMENVRMVRGKVEDTIPGIIPPQIALLRLDTDWYASTKHEMEHLYPLLSSGGVLIIDDYGYFKGAQQAVDEYFAQNPPAILLHRIDATARMAVRP